jgi:predicted short-subunit dehydrogenase-like oxidoreductase (DUF2520 family)
MEAPEADKALPGAERALGGSSVRVPVAPVEAVSKKCRQKRMAKLSGVVDRGSLKAITKHLKPGKS